MDKLFYQHTNGLAHVLYPQEVNWFDAPLVLFYLPNDPDNDGPRTKREWRAATRTLCALYDGPPLSAARTRDVTLETRAQCRSVP
jgi:hypothetical protein